MGITGLWAEEWLRQHYHLQMEMSDPYNLLAIVTFGNTEADIERLLQGLRAMQTQAIRPAGRYAPLSRHCLHHLLPPDAILAAAPREAFLAPAVALPLEQAVGRVSAEIISCCPPGIPALCPGEVITPEVVEYLNLARELGVRLQGPADISVRSIRVIK